MVCISTCGGVHKATTDSKVQISGHHLKQVSKVSSAPARRGRIAVRPVSAIKPHGDREGARRRRHRPPEGHRLLRQQLDDAAELRIVPADQIPDSGSFKLKTLSAKPRKAYYYGVKKPTLTYMFTNSQPTDVRIDVVKSKGRHGGGHAGCSTTKSRTRSTPRPGRG